MIKRLPLFLSLLLTSILFSCNEKKKSEIDYQLEKAEYLMSNYPDSALIILQDAATSAKRDNETYANWCLLKAWAQYRTYDDNVPEDELTFASNYFLAGNDHGKRALAYYLLSEIHSTKGIGCESEWVEYLLKGCKEVEHTQLYTLSARLYFSYAQAFLKREQPDKCIPLFLKSLDYTKKDGVKQREAMIYLNLAEAWKTIADSTHNYSNSIQYAEKAVRTAKENNISVAYGKALSILSEMYLYDNKYDVALKYARESKDLNEELLKAGKRKDIVRYVTIAQIHLGLNNIDSAAYYFRKGLDNPSMFNRVESYKGLYIINRDYLKKYQEAVLWGDKYYTLNDSIKAMMQNDKIAKLDDKYAKEQALKENAILRMQSRDLMLLSTCIISALLILILVVFIIYRHKLKKKEIKLSEIFVTISKNEEQISKNEQYINELKSMIHEGEDIQKQIEEQKEELVTLQSKTDKLRDENLSLNKSISSYKNIPSLKRANDMNVILQKMVKLEERERELSIELLNKDELISKLRKEPKFLSDSDREKIHRTINKIYSSFSERLVSSFPQLTPLDIQLCILIKFRFSIPQIAIMNAVSPTSISKHKLRLKKKILQSDSTLFDNGKSLDLFIWDF